MLVADVAGVAVALAAAAAREELCKKAGALVCPGAGEAVLVLLAGGGAMEGVEAGGALAILWSLQGGVELQSTRLSLGLKMPLVHWLQLPLPLHRR